MKALVLSFDPNRPRANQRRQTEGPASLAWLDEVSADQIDRVLRDQDAARVLCDLVRAVLVEGAGYSLQQAARGRVEVR